MNSLRILCAIVLLTVPAAVLGQEPAKPGPEHEVLKKWVAHWDATMKIGGMESKGVVDLQDGPRRAVAGQHVRGGHRAGRSSAAGA